MQYRAREKYDLVLLRHDSLVASAPFAGRVVQMQLATLKGTWLPMEKVNECNTARRDCFLSIIAVRSEKITVIAGRNLSLHIRDRKFLDSELIQHPRQHTPNSFQNDFLMFS